MSKITYEDYESTVAPKYNYNSSAPRTSNYIQFFSLKNNKDSAVVRILVDSTDDIDIESIHKVSVNGKMRNVNCVRTPKDPISMCPFCSANNKLEYKVYIPLIVYEHDENGQVISTPEIWERSTLYRDTLKEYLGTYGPLSNMIFRIVRNGNAGDPSTTYTILPMSSEMYTADKYPLDRELFKDFNIMNGAILELSAEEAQAALNGEPIARLLPKEDPNAQPQATQQTFNNYGAQDVSQQGINQTYTTPQQNFNAYGASNPAPANEYTPRTRRPY